MSSLTTLPDEVIIENIRNGDTQSATYLVEKYTQLVESIARKYFVEGSEYEDVLQEAFIGFYEAVKNYRIGSTLPFQNFAFYCIQKNIFDVIQSSHRQKRKAPAEFVSLDSEISEGRRETRLRVIDQIVHQKYINPEDVVVIKSLVKELVEVLTPLEKKVLKGYLGGKSYEEIGKEVNKEPKAVGNALQRARSKIKEYFLTEIKGEEK